MNEERRLILQMVEDKTITADEAVALLRALEEDEEALVSGEPRVQPRTPRPPRMPLRDPEDIGAWAENLAEQMAERGERLAEAAERIAERASRHAERIGEDIGSRIEATFDQPGVRFSGFNFFGPRVEDEKEFTFELVDGGPVQLDVTSNNGHVEVRPTDRSDIRVHLVRSAQAATRQQAEQALERIGHVEWDDRKLVVTPGAETPAWGWWSVGVRMRVTIEIPKDVAICGRVESKNGKMTFSSLAVPEDDELDVRTMNGRIELTGIQGGSITASTHNGPLRFKDVDASLTARTSNGSVRWRLQQASGARTVHLSTMNGSIRAAVPDGSGLDVTGGTHSGSVSSDVDGVEVYGRHHNRRLKGSRAGEPLVTLQLSTKNGSIKLFNHDGDLEGE